jgi:hypothetical protein
MICRVTSPVLSKRLIDHIVHVTWTVRDMVHVLQHWWSMGYGPHIWISKVTIPTNVHPANTNYETPCKTTIPTSHVLCHIYAFLISSIYHHTIQNQGQITNMQCTLFVSHFCCAASNDPKFHQYLHDTGVHLRDILLLLHYVFQSDDRREQHWPRVHCSSLSLSPMCNVTFNYSLHELFCLVVTGHSGELHPTCFTQVKLTDNLSIFITRCCACHEEDDAISIVSNWKMLVMLPFKSVHADLCLHECVIHYWVQKVWSAELSALCLVQSALTIWMDIITQTIYHGVMKYCYVSFMNKYCYVIYRFCWIIIN